MTLKNAAAGLPHGGGKSGIVADPKKVDKPRLIRAFARAIREIVDYIPGPDMGTDEACMGWIHDETGRAAGLPRVLGGIPLEEIGATGFGLAQCAEVAAPFCGLNQKIRRNTEAVLTRCRQEGIEPRQPAIGLARDRICEAMSLRRPF